MAAPEIPVIINPERFLDTLPPYEQLEVSLTGKMRSKDKLYLCGECLRGQHKCREMHCPCLCKWLKS